MFDNWAKYIVEAASLLGLCTYGDDHEPTGQDLKVMHEELYRDEVRDIILVAIELKKLDVLSPRHIHINGNGILEDLRHFKDDQ